MTVNDLIERLKQLPKDQSIAYVFWQPEDIKAEADSMSVELNKQEVEDVLFDMQDNADCEFGMTWTSVKCSIENIIENRLLITNKKGEYHE